MEKNNTAHEYPRERTVHSFFEEAAYAHPDRVAVEFEDEQVTYSELNRYADAIAAYLRKAGIGVNDVVAVSSKRSILMIAAIIAVWKAGAAYLPIEVGIPEERKQYYLEKSGAKAVISTSDEKTVGGLLNINLEKIPLDVEVLEENQAITSDSLAYVIFTSGSTGNPKGVMIQHYSVVNRLLWMKEQYGLCENDVFLQKTVCSFDVSVWELFLWFFCGAKLCLLPSGSEGNFPKLISTIQRHGVTVCHFVPSILRVFLRFLSRHGGVERIKSLKRVFSSGEALTYELICQFQQVLTRHNGTELHNLYGPTEATVDVTYFDCTGYISENESVPIGYPIWNTKIYILDENGRECPDGEVGEICISGDGVAAGYINNPELTKKAFVTDIHEPDRKMYRTGDLGRWHNDVVEYMGRVDNQVKIHGIRVELEEIESHLLQCPDVKDAIVIAAGEREKRLIAYYSGNNEGLVQSISEYLSEKLPKAMIPSEFIYIDDIPLKQNGKADRKALEMLYKEKGNGNDT